MTDVAPAPGPGGWQSATVTDVWPETPKAKTFRLALPGPSPHLAGQHYVIRLTAPDGYTAARSYSVSSPPDGSAVIEVTVERFDDGEVSAFLHDVVVPGDVVEVRGPIGGWFVWRGNTPALLVGAGSGVAPLMAMLRLARRSGRSDLVRLVVSARSPADLYYGDEIAGPETTVIYTRAAPPGWPRPPGRLERGDLAGLAGFTASNATASDATVYVCGSPSFADAATDLLTAMGVAPTRFRVERFGPTQ